MNLSRRALSIESSPTLSLNELAKNLQAEGKPVINLGVGEPTNPAPISSINSAISRLNSRYVKYSASGGTLDLKNAVAKYSWDHYNLTPKAKNVLVTVGAKQALYNALYAILNSDDEVILLAPYWVSYPEMVKMVSGKPVIVLPKIDTLEPSIDDIFAKITSRTKAIILNNPNNPSGVVYTPELVSELVTLCENQGIFLIMDDIYHRLVFGKTPWTSGFHYTSKDIDDSTIIVINGVSKTYGMTGFRIGWAVASTELISVMTNIQSQTTSGASILLQDSALGALTGSQEDVEELCETIRSNKDITVNGLKRLSRLNFVEPQGAFYCFPDFSAYQPDSTILARFLLEKAFVALVPGVAFGVEGYLRISYAGKSDEISEAIDRIHWALDPNSSDEILMGDQIYKKNW